MSAAEAENIPTNVSSGDAEAAVTAPSPAAKGAKAKKTKEVKPKKKPAAEKKAAPKKKASSSPPSHPKYEEMIKDAITTLKERTGSSQYAIQKFIEEKEKSLPPTFRKLLLVNLKRLVASEKLVKVKGSFKLPSAKSAPKPAVVKKKPAAVSKPKVAVKAPVKAKPAGKKTAAVAAKPKAKVVAKPKAKAKSVTAVSKTKAVVAKPKAKERPAKAARTSSRTSPGKKAAPAKKAAAVTKKKAPVKAVKSPAKRELVYLKNNKLGKVQALPLELRALYITSDSLKASAPDQNGLIRTHASMYRDKDVDKGFGPCVQLEPSLLYIPNPLFPPIYQSRNNHLGEATKGQDNLYCLGSPRCCHDNVLEPLLGLNIGTEYLKQSPCNKPDWIQW